MKRLVIAALACTAVIAAPAQAGGDAAAGKKKAGMCAGCHGPDGNSTNPIWPKLAGQHEKYLIKAMKDYKSGKRSEPMMKPMMAPLSDQDIENLAAYFASQEQK